MGLASRMAALPPGGGAPAAGAPASAPPGAAYPPAPGAYPPQQQQQQQQYGAPPPGAAQGGFPSQQQPQQPYPGQQQQPYPGQQQQQPGQPGQQQPYPGQQQQPQQGYAAQPGAGFPSQQQSNGNPFNTPSAPGQGYPPQQQQGAYPPQQQPGAYPPQQQQGAYPQQQQGAYPPQQQQQGGGGMPGARYQQHLSQRLMSTVQANGISAFYPQAKLQAVLQKAMTVDYDGLASRWRLPSAELALDLASLALYDIVMLCDDSGSMNIDDRVDDLKMVVEKVAEVATLFDDDGLVVRFLNSQVQGNGIKTAAEVQALVSQVRFSGLTPIGEKLQNLMGEIVYRSAPPKPLLVIIITDGVPDSKDAVVQAIQGCKQHMGATPFGAKAVAFEFAQVGNDMPAMAWLASLDNNPAFGDVVDITSHYEAEEMEWRRKNPGSELTPGMWLLKVMLGAIDPQYDEKD